MIMNDASKSKDSPLLIEQRLVIRSWRFNERRKGKAGLSEGYLSDDA
jgi:hypothetical protein